MKKIELFDTTLRDGIQGIDINFSLADKILATRKLDDLMIDFIEGGFPSSNKKDALYFERMKKIKLNKLIITAVAAAAACLLYQIPAVAKLFSMVNIPMVTFMVVGLLCLFNVGIMKTRLGQQFRAVGQNRTVANASGINVDRTRLIAVMISTVLAGWGQLIFVQNMGSFQTYGAHEQVGLYAGAAILVGGASIRKANNKQAILGCILFHLLFIMAPSAGKNLFGDAAIGEYFRVFISYGVIALALVMHAWSGIQKRKKAKAAAE